MIRLRTVEGGQKKVPIVVERESDRALWDLTLSSRVSVVGLGLQ